MSAAVIHCLRAEPVILSFRVMVGVQWELERRI